MEPDETLLQQMDALEGHQHPDTPSGAPPAVEAYWAEQGQRVVRYTRHGTAWIAWRWLVAMAVSGWHFIPDLVALEQGGAGYQWSNRYRRAYRRLRDTGCIEIYILALGRYRQVRLIRLSSSAQKLLGGEGIKVVQSDWEIMSEDHDPRGDQSDHTAHTVLAARMARLYGYQVEILPAEQPYVDLRLQDPDGEVFYVECEARKKSRAVRRQRKWQHQMHVQKVCAVVAKTPPARDALVAEITALHYDVLGTDLASLLTEPPAFWLVKQ